MGGQTGVVGRETTRVGSWLMVAELLVGGWLIGGCTSSAEPTPDPGAAISAPPVPIRDDLLPLDEMRPLISFGFDIRGQPVLDPRQFSLTTLRGPCGVVVTTPFERAGVESSFTVFRSTVSLVIEATAEPGAAVASSFIDELQADIRPGCPVFEEQLGAGAPAHLTYLSTVDLPVTGNQRVAWSQEAITPDGRVGFRYMIVVRGGDRVTLLAVLAAGSISPEALSRLAIVATTVPSS